VSTRLVHAEGALLERILDFTYPIWNEGLTRAAYGRWNGAQMRTPWGRDHLHRFALLDDGDRVLASAKRYRFDARLEGRDVRMAGIGAVFTPPEMRGHGHASELMAQLLERERDEGTAIAALFSEIGEGFYQRRGFSYVPIDEVDVEVQQKGGGAPAMLVRAGDDRDLPALAAMHDVRAGSAFFSLRRDVPLVHYVIAKKRLQAGLGPPGLRQTEFFVAEEGASAVAYVVISVSAGGWTLEEAGDRDPAGARLGAILQVLLAREPSQRIPLIRTWWPTSFPVPPQVRLTRRVAARDLFMLQALTDVPLPTRVDDVFYWRSDYF
jgi:GNAT superfamily N-acetyltransferase